MLVLTRKRNEDILIGPEIIVRVVDIRGGQVRIGIDAPICYPIVRRDSSHPDMRLDIPSKVQQLVQYFDNNSVWLREEIIAKLKEVYRLDDKDIDHMKGNYNE